MKCSLNSLWRDDVALIMCMKQKHMVLLSPVKNDCFATSVFSDVLYISHYFWWLWCA